MTSLKDQQKLLKDAGKGVEEGASKIFVEGKEYVVQDGDIMHFRFNV